MRTLLGFTGLLLWFGCVTSGQYVETPRIDVRIENNHSHAVDVRFYCGRGQRKSVRGITVGEVRNVRVPAGKGCDFRVTVARSIEGGPMTQKHRYDSGYHLYGRGNCESLDLRPTPMLSGTFIMPKGCP